MNIYALIIGVFVAGLVVLRFRARRLERTRWVYPALLATFPVYYLVFAIYASDHSALLGEFAAGAVFFAVSFIAYKFRSFATLLVLAIGYLAHGAYDFFHDQLLSNSGVPSWWPEFCGSVDAVIGGYLVFFAFVFRGEASPIKKR